MAEDKRRARPHAQTNVPAAKLHLFFRKRRTRTTPRASKATVSSPKRAQEPPVSTGDAASIAGAAGTGETGPEPDGADDDTTGDASDDADDTDSAGKGTIILDRRKTATEPTTS